mmetsp:Transcript_16997/g.26439  ORF Transcript_16997/g.26439 Transcript_16997/m.26439 type:complete len:206 (+) Transcript_16997:388-1005(+)
MYFRTRLVLLIIHATTGIDCIQFDINHIVFLLLDDRIQVQMSNAAHRLQLRCGCARIRVTRHLHLVRVEMPRSLSLEFRLQRAQIIAQTHQHRAIHTQRVTQFDEYLLPQVIHDVGHKNVIRRSLQIVQDLHRVVVDIAIVLDVLVVHHIVPPIHARHDTHTETRQPQSIQMFAVFRFRERRLFLVIITIDIILGLHRRFYHHQH